MYISEKERDNVCEEEKGRWKEREILKQVPC